MLLHVFLHINCSHFLHISATRLYRAILQILVLRQLLLNVFPHLGDGVGEGVGDGEGEGDGLGLLGRKEGMNKNYKRLSRAEY